MSTDKPSWQRCSGITLMRACISCQHYDSIGWDNDPYTPNRDWSKYKGNYRTPYGSCSKNNCEVFCTEICANYTQEEGIFTVEKPNRPVARQPAQQALI